MADYTIGPAGELPPGSKRVVTVRGIEIGVFNIDGAYYALPNRCTHQWGPLCEGALASTIEARADTGWRPEWVREGRVIVCPWHTLEFDVTTGQCLAHPRVKLRQYPVRVVDGQITLSV
jgi:nitrite reductase/ring-hydroxylating ferredoxin subunit